MARRKRRAEIHDALSAAGESGLIVAGARACTRISRALAANQQHPRVRVRGLAAGAREYRLLVGDAVACPA